MQEQQKKEEEERKKREQEAAEEAARKEAEQRRLAAEAEVEEQRKVAEQKEAEERVRIEEQKTKELAQIQVMAPYCLSGVVVFTVNAVQSAVPTSYAHHAQVHCSQGAWRLHDRETHGCRCVQWLYNLVAMHTGSILKSNVSCR